MIERTGCCYAQCDVSDIRECVSCRAVCRYPSVSTGCRRDHALLISPDFGSFALNGKSVMV